jgi:hypothetical protein
MALPPSRDLRSTAMVTYGFHDQEPTLRPPSKGRFTCYFSAIQLKKDVEMGPTKSRAAQLWVTVGAASAMRAMLGSPSAAADSGLTRSKGQVVMDGR